MWLIELGTSFRGFLRNAFNELIFVGLRSEIPADSLMKRNCWSSWKVFWDSFRLFGILWVYLEFPSSPRVNIDHDWSKCLNTLSLFLSLSLSLSLPLLLYFLPSLHPFCFPFFLLRRLCVSLSVRPRSLSVCLSVCFCNRSRISWSYFRFSYLTRRRSSVKELWHVNKNPPNLPTTRKSTTSLCSRSKKTCDNITRI